MSVLCNFYRLCSWILIKVLFTQCSLSAGIWIHIHEAFLHHTEALNYIRLDFWTGLDWTILDFFINNLWKALPTLFNPCIIPWYCYQRSISTNSWALTSLWSFSNVFCESSSSVCFPLSHMLCLWLFKRGIKCDYCNSVNIEWGSRVIEFWIWNPLSPFGFLVQCNLCSSIWGSHSIWLSLLANTILFNIRLLFEESLYSM